MTETSPAIPTTMFGGQGPKVTRVGLGGEGVLRTHGRTDAATEVIRAALDAGITYCDCARVYADSEKYYGAVYGSEPEKRDAVFQASKSAARDRDGALRDLEETLSRMNTGRLDLWQIHDVRTEDDLRAIGGKGGALEAFVSAREDGRVKHIGVTGHHDPSILTRAVKEWPVDSVLLPVNPVEAIIGGFLDQTLPAARERGIAAIGMKILGASHYVLLKYGVTAELLVRYALSYPITVAIVGCSSPEEVAELVRAGRAAAALSEAERKKLEGLFAPYAKKLAFYRGVV
jgi:aryl-alcohol dehydrogenase-like predicted oxidoreductase